MITSALRRIGLSHRGADLPSAHRLPIDARPTFPEGYKMLTEQEMGREILLDTLLVILLEKSTETLRVESGWSRNAADGAGVEEFDGLGLA